MEALREQARGNLRVIGDDERREPFVQVVASAGETIMGTLGTAAFGVYWHLCKRANNGQCWPSLDDISEATKLSRMHVTRMLDLLEDGGWITRTKRTNAYGMATSTLYTIIEKPHESGCNIGFTSVSHDELSDVTRTRTKPDTNQDPPTGEITPPTPPEKKSKRKVKAAPTYSEDFTTRFWALYPGGRGSKLKAFERWEALSEADRDDAVSWLPVFLQCREWKRGYHPGPEVWIGDRRWENPPNLEAERRAAEFDQASKSRPVQSKQQEASDTLDELMRMSGSDFDDEPGSGAFGGDLQIGFHESPDSRYQGDRQRLGDGIGRH